mmetsp:Transcript_36668/g.89636  ORF Transcript_36668/g.89636 Transcript_36668/m.89636 type:complete len:223 (+) Transcript_36668:2537-3205(+)
MAVVADCRPVRHQQDLSRPPPLRRARRIMVFSATLFIGEEGRRILQQPIQFLAPLLRTALRGPLALRGLCHETLIILILIVLFVVTVAAVAFVREIGRSSARSVFADLRDKSLAFAGARDVLAPAPSVKENVRSLLQNAAQSHLTAVGVVFEVPSAVAAAHKGVVVPRAGRRPGVNKHPAELVRRVLRVGLLAHVRVEVEALRKMYRPVVLPHSVKALQVEH